MIEIKKLKQIVEQEISTTEKRIERRNGPCFHDETARLHELNGRVYAYEKVLLMINEINDR